MCRGRSEGVEKCILCRMEIYFERGRKKVV